MKTQGAITKTYSITFDSKGKYSFRETTYDKGIELIVSKDNWEYESSTGVWYPVSKK